MKYQPPRYAAAPPAKPGGHHQVVVAGGGLVGLSLALDLAQRGVPVVLLDDDDTVSVGSRAICFAKRTLEIYDRLGLGTLLLDKGVTWNRGKIFFQEREINAFDLLPERGHHYPAFVNLQQYYAEAWLVEACQAAGVELRWRHRVASVINHPDHVVVYVETPGGDYDLSCSWLLACDGARSAIRERLALPFVGRAFRDRFLIADVEMQAPFPSERWFWFDPPFHRGQSVLLHRQADDIWRIDFQLGPDADPEEEGKPERVIPRVQAMLGETKFTLDWVSIYTFRCRRLEKFVHGRVIFAGDAAHQVSPFGARGGNGGVQDADNLAWKLAAILDGSGDPALLASYDAERVFAADENILHSTRSTDFISPKSEAIRAYRDATLLLAERFEFARPLINSGRLSLPAVLRESPLNDPAAARWNGAPQPGSPAIDAPVLRRGQKDWLLPHLGGRHFTLLAFADVAPETRAQLRRHGIETVVIAAHESGESDDTMLVDHEGLVYKRYGGKEAMAILFRPDQHVASVTPTIDAEHVLRVRRQILAGGFGGRAEMAA